MTKKRKYTKKSDYWNKFNSSAKQNPLPPEKIVQKPLSLSFNGETGPLMSDASAYSESPSTKSRSRRNAISTSEVEDEYKNIELIKIPFDNNDHGMSIRKSVELIEKAYVGISVFRNVIDVMTEFSSSDIYLTGGNKASRSFIKNWLSRINVDDITQQFFREYFRSGNVFLYSFLGRFTDSDFKRMQRSYAAKQNKIPLKYMIIDPKSILLEHTVFYEGAFLYKKVLSHYELQRLQNPRTEDDKEILRNLPQETRERIKSGTYSTDGIYVDLDPERFTAVAYKKQGYEPFGVPMGWGTLRDINIKEEMKKRDQAIGRTIEQAILLITMGEEEEKGGINWNHLQEMQKLMSQESVGRVLVSDYTTKAEFIIPQVADILDPKKYEVINRDIREGLQSIMVGDDKFANQMIKVQVFLERLKEGRKEYLNKFLQREIDEVCKTMNFKSIPTANFVEIDLKDEVQLSRLYTRLVEIGVLTPEQGFKAMKTGILPQPEELKEGQEAYIEQRKKGLYNPLMGGQSMDDEKQKKNNSNPNATNNGRPPGSNGTPQSTKNVSPQGTSSASTEKYSIESIHETYKKIGKISAYAERLIKKKYKLNSLNDSHNKVIAKLISNTIVYNEEDKWNKTIKDFIEQPNLNNIFKENSISRTVDEIASTHDIDYYNAAILYHSREKNA